MSDGTHELFDVIINIFNAKIAGTNPPVRLTSQKMKVTTNSKCAKVKLRTIIINRTLRAFH